MRFPSMNRVVWGLAIALGAIWIANNVQAVRDLVGPRNG